MEKKAVMKMLWRPKPILNIFVRGREMKEVGVWWRRNMR